MLNTKVHSSDIALSETRVNADLSVLIHHELSAVPRASSGWSVVEAEGKDHVVLVDQQMSVSHSL